jgi:hypothetical protein
MTNGASMMNTMKLQSSIERRLAHLETAHGGHGAVLVFSDGSRRAITLKHPLDVLCSAMSLLAYYTPPGAGDEEDRGHQFPDVPKHHHQLIRMIGKASSIETDDDVFLENLLHPMCRGVVEDESSNGERKAPGSAR